MKKTYKILGTIGIITLILIAVFVIIGMMTLAWNWVFPVVFGVGKITLLKMAVLITMVFLIGMLFKLGCDVYDRI